MLLERAPATRVETESTGRIDPAALIEEARTRQRRRRARWWAAFVTGAALCALAYGIDRATSGTAGSGICDTAACSGTAATKPSDGFDRPVYGFSRIYAAQSVLSRFDLTTLRQTGRRLLVPRDLEPEGISPDGRYAVLVGARAAHAKHAAHALSLVALPALRIDTAIQSRLDSALAGQYVAAARWLGPHRLVVVAARAPRLRGTFVDTTMRVVAIDPDAGTVEWSRPLGSRPPAIEAAVVERRLVLVFEAAPGALRRVAVLVVSPSGRIRTSQVEIPAEPRDSIGARLVAAGDRAFVLAAPGLVDEIDPLDARITRHPIATPKGAPTASPPFPFLRAAAVGSNLAVSNFFPSPDGHERAGIYVVDTSTWRARIVEPTTPEWFTTGGSLVSFTNAGRFRLPAASATKGTGVRIYDANGDLRSHLFGTQAFSFGGLGFPTFAAVAVPGTATEPVAHTASQVRVRNAALKFRELLFDPATGESLGTRTVTGYPPGLLRRGNPQTPP
jgi:hypothetical protein